MAFLDPVFNPILQPLLDLSPFLGILIISFLISLMITLVYKFVTNQELMKTLKEKQKEFQGKMKELRSNPEEMIKVQKEAMKYNLDYMKHSFKPTLITMLPILLIFGWMTGHLSYEPIYPGEMYSITAFFEDGLKEAELILDDKTVLSSNSEQMQEITGGSVTWKLKSEEGEHLLTVKSGDTEEIKKVLITTSLNYLEPITYYEHSDIKQININYNKLKPLGPDFTVPLFNWQPGWLGLYIIFSLVFSMGLRKMLKLY